MQDRFQKIAIWILVGLSLALTSCGGREGASPTLAIIGRRRQSHRSDQEGRHALGLGMELYRPAREWDKHRQQYAGSGRDRYQLAVRIGRPGLHRCDQEGRHALGLGTERYRPARRRDAREQEQARADRRGRQLAVSFGRPLTHLSNQEGRHALGLGLERYRPARERDNPERDTPVQVGTDTHWRSAAAGADHTVAIKKDGTLWAWGANHSGELGNGTNESSYTPVQVGAEPLAVRGGRLVYHGDQEGRHALGLGMELFRPAREWDNHRQQYARPGRYEHRMAVSIGRRGAHCRDPEGRHALGLGT